MSRVVMPFAGAVLIAALCFAWPVSAGGSEPANIEITSVFVIDDGSADPICLTGDPNPANDPSIAEHCPGRTHAECDSPGMPGTGSCGSVPDGIADRGEAAIVRLFMHNLSTLAQTGAPRALNNLTIGITLAPSPAACAQRGQSFVGNVTAGANFTTPAGALSFVLDPAGPIGAATIDMELTAQADDVAGLQPPRSFSLEVGFDRLEFPRIPASCSGIQSANAPGVLCETFETQRDATSGFQFTRLAIGADPVDSLLALGDPNDDVLGYTQGTGGSPLGTSGVTCLDDVGHGSGTCDAPVGEENDWHLHSPHEGPGDGYDPLDRPGIGAPDGGKAYSGVRSMHWGRHTDPSSTLYDTVRFRQVAAFVLDPPVHIGPATKLDFWQIMKVLDDESPGLALGLPPGATLGGGQVQISLLGSSGQFDRWQTLLPSFNSYNSLSQDSAPVCEFDPGDDQRGSNNESMCELMPMWSDIGAVVYTGNCVIDIDVDPRPPFPCGDITCFPFPNPTCVGIGSSGYGTWARSAFDLSSYSGRTARLRWIGMMGGGLGFGTDRSPLEPETGAPSYHDEDDDGWWIDDIKLTDLRTGAAVIQDDPSSGSAVCDVAQDPLYCGTINIDLLGSVGGAGGRRLLGHNMLSPSINIDVRRSTARDDPGTPAVEGACDFGILEYQFSELDASGAVVGVLSPFSPTAVVPVAPSSDTLYLVEARCTSDPACTAAREVVVMVYSGEGSDIVLDVTGAAMSAVRWTARPQPPGVSGYDLFRFDSGPATGVDLFPGNQFSGSCFGPDVAQRTLGSFVQGSDSSLPAPDTTYMYQVSHSSQAVGAINPLGVRPAPGPHAGQLVMAGVACP